MFYLSGGYDISGLVTIGLKCIASWQQIYNVLNSKGFYGLKTYLNVVSKLGNEISLKFNTQK